MSHSHPPYPDAYCVKCGKHTATLSKHTVVMANGSRALNGVCSQCESEVYKFMPKIRAARTRMPLTAEEQKRYPDAFCLKCKAHTPTHNAHTVILDNMSRAVTGACKQCGSEVFRILNHFPEQPAMKTDKVSLPLTQRQQVPVAAMPLAARTRWVYVGIALIAIGMGIGYFLLK